MLDFQSINGFIKVKAKSSCNIDIKFNNRNIIFTNCSNLLLNKTNYSMILNLTLLKKSIFDDIFKIIHKNESQVIIDSSDRIDQLYGSLSSKEIYYNESIGLSKYNYNEKLKLSELFQQNKYTFTLSHVSYRDKDSIDAPY